MGNGTKTDNHSPGAKLDLRRWFLRKYHTAKPPRVIDCCQGSGKLWGQLRLEFPLGSYWGLDEKPRSGRLKIDSARVLVQPGWRADVVDVDTYGSPWNHWLALLPNVREALSVFLTVGQVKAAGGGQISNAERDAIGLRFQRLNCPRALHQSHAAHEYILARMLSLPLRHGLKILECQEAPQGKNARYFGLRLEPRAS